jgi:hypothetical protein
VTWELRAHILSFYEHFDPTQAPKGCKACRNIPREVEELKAAPVPSASAPVAHRPETSVAPPAGR